MEVVKVEVMVEVVVVEVAPQVPPGVLPASLLLGGGLLAHLLPGGEPPGGLARRGSQKSHYPPHGA